MYIIKFYISDLHIGHKNCLTFDNRPYFTLEEMKNDIIDKWNSVVTANDEVYSLGDMFWNNDDAIEVLPKLNGKKFLVLGNHDRINADMRRYFIWIKEIETVNDGDKHVVLSHYPIAHWKNQDRGYVHLYGHIHQGRDSRPFEIYKKMCQEEGIMFEAYNVGCMMPYMNYQPKILSEIINTKI